MRRFARREWIGLTLAVVIGWGVGQILTRTVPLGTDVRGSPVAAALLHNRAAPSLEVPRPTLTLVVFGDYQCPACKQAELELAGALSRDRHVRVVYREWPIFGPLSERAARVALAADRQGIYPAVHARLMNARRPPDEALLRETVEAAGGDWTRLMGDLRDHDNAIDAELAGTRREVVALGIKGTPSYLAGPLLILGALDENGFTRAFAQGRALQAR